MTAHRIYDLYVNQNESPRGIVGILREDEIETHQGGTRWAPTSVSRILGNETYTGTWQTGKTKVVKGKRVKRPRSEWIPVRVPAIICRSTFAVAQDRRRHNKLVKRQQGKRFYLLSGMVFCADCGKPYVAQTTRAGHRGQKVGTRHYRERADRGGCRNQQVSGELLERTVWNTVKDALLDPVNLRKGYEKAIELEVTARKRLEQRVKKLEIEREQIRAKLDTLTDAYLDPDLGIKKSEFIRQRDRLESDRLEIDRRVKSTHEEVQRTPSPVEMETVEAFASEIRKRLGGDFDIASKEKRDILELLHVRALIDADRQVRITGWFAGSPNGRLSRIS